MFEFWLKSSATTGTSTFMAVCRRFVLKKERIFMIRLYFYKFVIEIEKVHWGFLHWGSYKGITTLRPTKQNLHNVWLLRPFLSRNLAEEMLTKSKLLWFCFSFCFIFINKTVFRPITLCCLIVFTHFFVRYHIILFYEFIQTWYDCSCRLINRISHSLYGKNKLFG